MSKSGFKNLFCSGLTLALFVGCAHTQTQTEPRYSALPTGPSPTSDQPAERVYPDGGNTTRTTPPPGVTAEDWNLNEKVRALFLDNKKLAPPPSEVNAVVDQKERGIVHLSGHVSNGIERRRVIDAVSKIPGVTRVDDDQLMVGAHQPTGTRNLKTPD